MFLGDKVGTRSPVALPCGPHSVSTAVRCLTRGEEIGNVRKTLGLVVLQEEVTERAARGGLDAKRAIVAMLLLVFGEPLLRVVALGL